MKKILKKLASNRLGQVVILSLTLSLFVSLLKLSGGFSQVDFKRLDNMYQNRSFVEKSGKINTWAIEDYSVDMSKWPWSWGKFSEMFKLMETYGSSVGVIQEDYFSELGKMTVRASDVQERRNSLESLLNQSDDSENQSVDAIIPDKNEELIKSLKQYGKSIFSQKFIIPDEQDPKQIKLEFEKYQSRFSEEKKQKLELIKKFGIPWRSPGKLMQAVDVIPLHPKLSAVVSHVGFDRIVADADGKIRRSPTVVYFDKHLYFSHAILALIQNSGVQLEDVKVFPGEYILIKGASSKNKGGDIKIPIDEQGLMYINWVGAEFNAFSFELVGKFLLSEMAKKLINQKDLEGVEESVVPYMQNFKEKIYSTNIDTLSLMNTQMYKTLGVWLSQTILNLEDPEEDDFEMTSLAEANDQKNGVFSDIEEELKKRGDNSSAEEISRMYSIQFPLIFESMRVNRSLLESLKKGEGVSLEELKKKLNIEGNRFSVNTFGAFGISDNCLNEMIQKKFMAILSRGEETLIELNYTGMSREDLVKRMLKKGLVKSKNDTNLETYLTVYDLFENHKRILKEGYLRTKHLFEKGKIEEFRPLYFEIPSPHMNNSSPLDINKKVVFVGLRASGLRALNPTPYNVRESMANLQPAVFNTIITEAFIQEVNVEYLLIFVYSLFIILITLYTPFYISLPTAAGLGAGHYFFCLWIFEKEGLIFGVVSPIISLTLAYVGANIYSYWEQRKEREQVRGMFAAMVSPEVLKIMEEDPDKFNLKGDKVEASMFSSDVSGFTTISEGVTAQELANILNLYLTPMSNLVMVYGGYVEKYEGDAIKADFGMPMEDPEHAWKSCYSALLQQEELLVVQRMLQLKYGVMITARMGVNTGFVSAGNMGSENKMQYCALGEAVAMAEELEPSNKMWETWISMGPETHRQVKDKIHSRLLDDVIYEHVTWPVYEVLGWKREDYLKYWTGKSIPPLIIEGWEKIIPEKVIAYLDYYKKRGFPSNEFLNLQNESFQGLEGFCIEYTRDSDQIEAYRIETEFTDFCKQINSHNKSYSKESLSEIDRSEIERFEASLENSKEPWQKKIHGYLLELKRCTHILNQLMDELDKKVTDDYSTIIDTLEKRSICFLKRIQFPIEEDRIGNLHADALKVLLLDPTKGMGVERVQTLEKQVSESYEKIKQGMKIFIEKARAMAESYHQLMAEHCIVSVEKQKVCDIFAEGRSLYLNRDWDGAMKKFQSGLEIVSDDGPCLTFIDRCEKFKKTPPEEGWTGQWVANW